MAASAKVWTKDFMVSICFLEAIRIDPRPRRLQPGSLHCLQSSACSVLKLNQQRSSGPEMREQDTSKILNAALGVFGAEDLMQFKIGTV